MDFQVFAASMQAHLERENFADGLELLDQQAANFPSHVARMSLWRIALLAGVGETTAATEMLERALENGVWYSEKLLRTTAPLETLAGVEEFERLVSVSVQMQLADPASAMPLIAVHAEGQCQSENNPCPLLLFLHDKEETPQEHLHHWRSVPTMGWLLAMPQSVQALWAGAYTWEDTQVAQEQITMHYDDLRAGYQLDSSQLVLGGKGAGAQLALKIAASDRIPASGLVLYQPGGDMVHQPARWETHIAQASENAMRVVIIADDTIAQQLDILTGYFDEHKLAYKVGTFPATAEAYPQGFENSLSNALDFLENPPDNS